MATNMQEALQVMAVFEAGDPSRKGTIRSKDLPGILKSMRKDYPQDELDVLLYPWMQQEQVRYKSFVWWLFGEAAELRKSAGFGKALNPMSFALSLPLGHDLTMHSEHAMYTMAADAMYRDMSLDDLRDLEMKISGKIQDTWNHSTLFHIAVKDAISKKLMDNMPVLHCTVVYAMYKEQNRILPKGPSECKGFTHINGENFVRRKHEQMTWLFQNRPDCSWDMIGSDDGCPEDSSGIMDKISAEMGYTNCRTIRLKEAVKAGSCPALDNDKLKSEAWDENDKLVKSSQKGGTIIYALWAACEDTPKYAGKRHVIVYTDSDLSTDLRLCGLNFNTIFNENVDCSVSQRFGQPFAVNCGKLLEVDGKAAGIGPGMPRESMIHLSLRHKLRMNLLPPLSVVTDTNCGHKAILAEAVKDVLPNVQDYKGSFDMDWLMCVGINSKRMGRNPIGVTAIPWVNSVGESNFWAAPGGDDDAAAAKLKTCTSWHKIFATMCEIHEWHKAGLEKEGLLTAEAKEYVEWVKAMDVNSYMKLSDAIFADLGDKEITMPEPTIMNYDLVTLKNFAA